MIHDSPLSSPSADDRRSVRRDQRTQAILDAAMAIVESAGFDALTLHKVAESMGYATTAIYRYFPSKDALSAALQRRAIAEIHAHHSAEIGRAAEAFAPAAPATRSLALLLVAADTYLALPTTHPRAFHFVAVLLGDPRPLLSDEEAGRTAILLGAFITEVDALFADAESTRALDAGPRTTRLLSFWASLHGATCLEKTRRLSLPFPGTEQVGRASARALLSGWGASSQRLTAAEDLVLSFRDTRPARGTR